MSSKFLNTTYFTGLSFVFLGLLLPCSVEACSLSTGSDCELSLMQNDVQNGFSSLAITAAKEGLPKRRVGGGSR